MWLLQEGGMKVLVTTFGGDGGKSGISQYIIQLLRHLPSVAPDMTFDVLLLEEEKAIYVADPDRIRPLLQNRLFRNPITNILWQQTVLPLLCARGGYDVLFVPAGNRRMPYWAPCPSVGTFHDLAIVHIPGKYDRLHNFYNLHVMPVLVRRLSHVIAVSESTKQDLLKYVRVPENRITVIPEAADQTLYFPRDKTAAQEKVSRIYGIRPPYVLFISRIEHPGKNHVRLIRAFDRAKRGSNLPHQLVLAGSDWGRAEEVHREANTCASKDSILFTGFVAGGDLPDLYAGADAFVFPSLFEGFGLPVLEAMSCGIPVACSNVSSMPEVAGDAALLFDPEDERSIEQALTTLLTDKGTQQDLVRRGLQRSKTFSWQRTAELTAETLRRTAREKKR